VTRQVWQDCCSAILLAMCVGVSSCVSEPDPPSVNLSARPQGSSCQALAVACYDEFSRTPVQLICVRSTSRWSRTELTWRLANTLSGLDASRQEELASQAFSAWADVSSLSFAPAMDKSADITITFAETDHGDPFPFDGAGRNLGHAFFPGSGSPGEIHLCAAESWALDNATADQFDLLTVLIHEIGHALGAEHSLDSEAIMWPEYQGPKTDLSGDDIDAIQKLYGSADGTVSPLDDPQPNDFKEPLDLTAMGDPDTDGDGIPDTVEVFALNTNPFEGDSDEDGVPDREEIFVRGSAPGDPADAGTPGMTTDNSTLEPDPCDVPGGCSDGRFCDGLEMCLQQECVSGPPPCMPDQFCDEVADRCVECLVDGDCADQTLCTDDQCVDGLCMNVPTRPCTCADFLDCSGCAAAPNCGWCFDECLPGTIQGPEGGMCTNWAFLPGDCPSLQ